MSDAANRAWRLMIVAGEASGDAHAARLVEALREAAPDRIEFFGATGARMREGGVETIVRSDELAIVGTLEITRSLPRFLKAFRALRRAAIERLPDAVILVDWPDFNFRLARAFRRRGLRVIYFISPQLWAWRSYRVRNIRRDVDLLLAILPFERDWYARRGVKHVEFVGHPLAGQVCPRVDRAGFCAQNALDPARPIVALLPGSRHGEFNRILPPMLGAAAILMRARPEIQFVLPVAPGRSRAEARSILLAAQIAQDSVCIVEGETYEALGAADVAAIASGTATLEAALIGTPMVVVYKESALNWHTLRPLIRAEHFGLVNLIAGKRLATELMQYEFTATRLAAEISTLLDAGNNQRVREELRREVIEPLGPGGASRRAAEAVINALREWSGTGDAPV